jgi:hypothetical protein
MRMSLPLSGDEVRQRCKFSNTPWRSHCGGATRAHVVTFQCCEKCSPCSLMKLTLSPGSRSQAARRAGNMATIVQLYM